MRGANVAIFVHFVWSTWDRLPLLTIDLRRAVQRAIEAKAEALGATVVAIGGVEDDVHLLVKFPATVAVADFVGQVKGASAHLVNHELMPRRAFKWQGGYAAFSVESGSVPRIINYVARQVEHHASGTLVSEWEQTSELADTVR